jgi:hypothetical protein
MSNRAASASVQNRWRWHRADTVDSLFHGQRDCICGGWGGGRDYNTSRAPDSLIDTRKWVFVCALVSFSQTLKVELRHILTYSVITPYLWRSAKN